MKSGTIGNPGTVQLSVIYKAPPLIAEPSRVYDAVVQTDSQFNIIGVILYDKDKAIHTIGSFKDPVVRKKSSGRFLKERVKEKKKLHRAIISAQERERNNISRELHDNVNQILISARLFMVSAMSNNDQQEELLKKAVEYQNLALDEIRRISQTLNNTLVKTIGLKESIEDIVQNMKSLQRLDVEFRYNKRIEEKLSDDQQLMVYRIIQEQTSNIIKYAEAKSVKILLNVTSGNFHLLISDDGKGFNPKAKSKGIGLVNIMSRVDAYQGKIDIISSPGNGCTLELQFPF